MSDRRGWWLSDRTCGEAVEDHLDLEELARKWGVSVTPR